MHVRKPGDDAFEAWLKPLRARLYEAREQRIHPGLDDKVITAWNGLMQKAFAEAAVAFNSDTYRDAARNNADFLLGEMRADGRLLRTWKDGTARIKGYLEDYACLIDALMATDNVRSVIHMKTLHIGPDELIVAAKVEFEPTLTVSELAASIDAAERALRDAVPISQLVYIEPDVRRAPVDTTPA